MGAEIKLIIQQDTQRLNQCRSGKQQDGTGFLPMIPVIEEQPQKQYGSRHISRGRHGKSIRITDSLLCLDILT